MLLRFSSLQKLSAPFFTYDAFFGVGGASGKCQGGSGGYLVGPWENLDIPRRSYRFIGWFWVVFGGPWELLGGVLGVF